MTKKEKVVKKNVKPKWGIQPDPRGSGRRRRAGAAHRVPAGRPHRPPLPGGRSRSNGEFVVYRGNNETLVTIPEVEEAMVKEWFGPGERRVLDNYSRMVVSANCVRVASIIQFSWC